MGKIITKAESRWMSSLHRKGAALGLPIAGNFELTSKCNFNCRMCYVHDQNNVDELSAAEWVELGRQARDQGMVFLLLTGGEPFIRPDFKEIYTGLSELGLLITINTNGSLIDDKMLEFLVSRPPLRMNISLYACDDKVYTELCGRAACQTVKQNIRKLREAGITVKLNASITPYNATEIEEIFSFAQSLDIPVQATTYMFPPVRINGCQFGDAPARFTPEDAAQYLLKCKEEYLDEEYLAKAAEGVLPDEELCYSEEGENMRSRAGKTAFWVTWDGRMLPCGMFPGAGSSIRKVGFAQAWEETRTFVQTIRLPKECAACPKKNRCAACAAACIAESGDSTVCPEYVCRLTHEYDRLLCEKYR